ncbi:hypothetical protein Q4V65_38615 [Kutzneria buriramensis]|nr:hypothetical protein [Kutzneria buriramensis]
MAQYAVAQGGKSIGSCRQDQPERTTYKTASRALPRDFSEYADTCTAVAASSHGASRKSAPRVEGGP